MLQDWRVEEEERRREREALDTKREEFALDLRAVAETPAGARFLGWLLDRGNIYRNDYLPGPTGAYAAGKKAAALELWALLREALPHEAFVAIAVPDRGEET